MKKVVFIIVLFMGFHLMAQSSNSNNARLDNIGINDFGNGMWVKSSNSQTEIKGSPYLYESWFNSGKVFFSNRVINLPSFNYNMKLERFEAKITDDSIFAVDPQGVKKVEIRGNEFIRTLDPEFQRNSYFQVIAKIKGKMLLEKHIVELKEGQINPMTMQKQQKDALIKKEIFYLANDEGKNLKNFKMKKKSVLSLVNKSKVAKIKEFAKSHKLKFKKVEDVKALLKFAETI